jgi:uroporphyrinogen decarboxylase
MLVVVGGEPMLQAARRILERLGPGGLVFNLGHGLVPQTPPEHVAALCDLLRSWKA